MSTIQKEVQEHYRAKEGAKLLCIGESTYWKWVKDGRLPPGIKIGPRVTVWKRSDLLALIDGGAA